MDTEDALLKGLMKRSGSGCELCTGTIDLSVYPVPHPHHVDTANIDQSILLCEICRGQIENPETVKPDHWRCLNDSMWSQIPVIQVMVWRMLTSLVAADWPQNLLDMLYLEDDILTWAKAGVESSDKVDNTPTIDSNGAVLQAGDTVTLIKDLSVKGAGFTAKRGTAVRNISLTSNPDQIEGRVNGVRIVLLTCYLKKSN